jgi:hypothetical protein
MANYFPLTLVSGTLDLMSKDSVVNPAFFPMTRSVAPTSGSFATLLPDSYYFQTNSVNSLTDVGNVTQSVFTFSVPTRIERQYYMTEALLGGQSIAAATTGPRVSVSRANLADGVFSIRAATNLTSVAVLNQGSADAETTASMTTTVANNIPVPIVLKGIFSNSTTNGIFNNTVKLNTVPAGVQVQIKSGSTFYNHFAGLSASLAPFTSSRAPISLISGTLDSIAAGDLINAASLPPTASYWLSSSLSTTITNSSSTNWVTIFTLTGLTDNKRYLGNYFLKCEAAATTTGVHLRVASASNYTGLLYSLSSGNNNPPSISSSSGSGQIVNKIPTGIPSANSTRLFWGEYTFTKAAGLNPTVEIQSEVNTSQVLAQSGSVVLWRLLE